MLVSYFIPEDGDSPQHPNVFSCEATGLTLQDLKKAFPVPGIYHFRALKAVGDMKVWLDLVSDSATVPAYRGEVVLKVTRISLGRGSNTPIASSSPSKQSSQQRVAPSQVNVDVEVSEEKQTPQSSQSQQGKGPVARMAAPERRGSEKLLSFDTFDDSNTTPPASTASPFDSNAGDVFDFSTQDSQQQKQQTQAPQHQRNNSNNSMNDFMNFPASTSTPPPMMNNSMQGGMGGMGNMSGMGGGMNRGGGSSGNINGMMNSSNARQQQQQQQQKNRNAMGGIDPFGNFN